MYLPLPLFPPFLQNEASSFLLHHTVKGGRANIQSPVWLTEPELLNIQLPLFNNWNGLSGEMQCALLQKTKIEPSPWPIWYMTAGAPVHDLPPAMSSGISSQWIPLNPSKSQFLLANAAAPTQTVSFVVFLFFPAIFLPDTIQIKMTILLSIFTVFMDHFPLLHL